jgi:hypothetical protein
VGSTMISWQHARIGESNLISGNIWTEASDGFSPCVSHFGVLRRQLGYFKGREQFSKKLWPVILGDQRSPPCCHHSKSKVTSKANLLCS